MLNLGKRTPIPRQRARLRGAAYRMAKILHRLTGSKAPRPFRDKFAVEEARLALRPFDLGSGLASRLLLRAWVAQ
jgi:hypothetical protein